MAIKPVLIATALLSATPITHAAVSDQWTNWLSRDRPSGSGDYEMLRDFQREQPSQICEQPSLIEARIRGDKTATVFSPDTTAPAQLRTFSAEQGLACVNKDQEGTLCPDFEVRFLCAPTTFGALGLKADSADVFLLEKPTKTANAIAVVSLDKASREQAPAEFTLLNDQQVTVLNDRGEGADAKARDGQFSGFLMGNIEEVEKTQARISQQLSLAQKFNKDVQQVRDFSGRSIRETHKLDAVLEQHKKLILEKPRLIGDIPVLPLIPPLPPTQPPALVQPENALAITDTSVVANPNVTFDPCDTDGMNNDIDPDALYSFKTLISNLNDETAPGRPSDQQFVHDWLSHWLANSPVNGFNIPPRMGILDYFPGWDGVNANTLDMDRLPFRLLAIVNRIDLGNIAAYGNSNPNKPGEIRFVFGLLKMNSIGSCIGNGIAGGIDQMTVIFEYSDATNSCSTSKALANDWLDLDAGVINGTAPLGGTDYMAALKLITDTVTVQGANKLNQLRTNDFAFDGLGSISLPWQLREFVIGDPAPDLIPTTIKQTPQFSEYRNAFGPNAAILADYVVNAAVEPAGELLCDAHSVPLQYEDPFNPGVFLDFLGSHTDYASNTSWPVNFNGTVLPASFPSCYSPSYVAGSDAGLSTPTVMQIEMRHKLSINACDDCHADETDTVFTHISPVTRGLSGFMTGTLVNDPTPSPIQREFNDLARRNQALSSIAGSFCGFGPSILNGFAAQQAQLRIEH